MTKIYGKIKDVYGTIKYLNKYKIIIVKSEFQPEAIWTFFDLEEKITNDPPRLSVDNARDIIDALQEFIDDVAPKEPVEEPEKRHTYLSGFQVGDRVRILGAGKYNSIVVSKLIGQIGTVVEPPANAWSLIADDAVNISVHGIKGLIDSSCIEKHKAPEEEPTKIEAKTVETCSSCKFYSKEACKRYPPTMVFNSDDNDLFSDFPEVSSYGWCGEYKTR